MPVYRVRKPIGCRLPGELVDDATPIDSPGGSVPLTSSRPIAELIAAGVVEITALQTVPTQYRVLRDLHQRGVNTHATSALVAGAIVARQQIERAGLSDIGALLLNGIIEPA